MVESGQKLFKWANDQKWMEVDEADADVLAPGVPRWAGKDPHPPPGLIKD